MTDTFELNGKCLCGAVGLTATTRKPAVVACHCDMCRRWASGPFMSVSCLTVDFAGAQSVGRIRSSDAAERGFCTQCGSNLYYRRSGSDVYQIAAGLFEETSGLGLSLQLFVDEKPHFYDFANDTKTMTGDQFAKAVRG